MIFTSEVITFKYLLLIQAPTDLRSATVLLHQMSVLL